MKRIILLLFITSSVIAYAQNSKNESLLEINNDVWIPFREGVNTDQAHLYIDVHSKDFHWVAPGSKGRIMDFAEYVEDSKNLMARRRETKEKSEVQIRFLERNVKGDFASERCITEFRLHKDGGTHQISYGVTQFFLRKENGTWKIFLQHGSSEKADQKIFTSALTLEDVEKWEM